MNFKNCMQAVSHPKCASTALLFLRLVVGIAFLYHGWGKIQNPMGWMGPDSTVPGVFQFLGAFAEFGGGIALILGLVTRLAALGLAFTMAVAVYMHLAVMGDPFVNMTGSGGSYEPALGYLAISLLFIAMGPGKFSLDAKLFGEKAAC